MTIPQFIAFCIVFCLLSLGIAIGAWMCWRRTGGPAFLVLGALLILWPSLHTFSEAMIESTATGVILGRPAYVFPFPLLEKIPTGEYGFHPEFWRHQWGIMDRLHAVKWLAFLAVCAVTLALIARCLKRPGRPKERA